MFRYGLVFLFIQSTFAIKGGRPADDGQFPSAVSVTNAFNAYYCGGSILNNLWVLTAGQCVYDESFPGNVKVHTGSTYIASGTRYDIVQIIVHPDFNAPTLANDVAVLKTSTSIIFNAYTQPIALLSRDIDGDDLLAAGWGREQQNGSFQTYLQFYHSFAISQSRCSERIEINPDNLCAFESIGLGMCIGDAGIGYEVPEEGLAGIGSFYIEDCGAGWPDGIASVPYHREWIIKNTI